MIFIMVKRTFYLVELRVLRKNGFAISRTELCYDLPKSSESLIVGHHVEIEIDDSEIFLFKTLMKDFSLD